VVAALSSGPLRPIKDICRPVSMTVVVDLLTSMRALEGGGGEGGNVAFAAGFGRRGRTDDRLGTAKCFNQVYLAHDLLMGQALLLLRPPKLGILDVQIGRDRVFPLAAEFRAKLIPIIFSAGDAASKLPPEWSTNPIIG
jgi:hypothetical protein